MQRRSASEVRALVRNQHEDVVLSDRLSGLHRKSVHARQGYLKDTEEIMENYRKYYRTTGWSKEAVKPSRKDRDFLLQTSDQFKPWAYFAGGTIGDCKDAMSERRPKTAHVFQKRRSDINDRSFAGQRISKSAPDGETNPKAGSIESSMLQNSLMTPCSAYDKLRPKLNVEDKRERQTLGQYLEQKKRAAVSDLVKEIQLTQTNCGNRSLRPNTASTRLTFQPQSLRRLDSSVTDTDDPRPTSSRPGMALHGADGILQRQFRLDSIDRQRNDLRPFSKNDEPPEPADEADGSTEAAVNVTPQRRLKSRRLMKGMRGKSGIPVRFNRKNLLDFLYAYIPPEERHNWLDFYLYKRSVQLRWDLARGGLEEAEKAISMSPPKIRVAFSRSSREKARQDMVSNNVKNVQTEKKTTENSTLQAKIDAFIHSIEKFCLENQSEGKAD